MIAEGSRPGSGEGTLLSLIATGQARSRSELVDVSGLSRATVAQRLSVLLGSGLVDEAQETMRSGGRPAKLLRLNTTFALALAADIGEQRTQVALTTLDGTIIDSITEDLDIRRGPVAALTFLIESFDILLANAGRRQRDVLGVGLSLPAPVDYARGRIVGPSVMAGWDDFDIRTWFAARFEAPLFVENDVNLLMLADYRRAHRDAQHLFYVKIGTGIGSGIVTGGRIYRGAQGAAGDIGHIQFNRQPAPLCRCGKIGCLEARAAGWAIARDLRAERLEAETARDVVALVRAGEPRAIHLVRQSGRVIGEVVANVVSILNPSAIVIGGTLAAVEEYLLSGIREMVYSRSLPLATRELEISVSPPDPDAGIVGAALLVVEEATSPGHVASVVERYARAS
jgi:predicted NBD/HSP70 family sugar kinase